MRKVSKASELFLKGKWNYSNIQYDGVTDTAVISILKHEWPKWRKFKVKNYSKGKENWEIMEDE